VALRPRLFLVGVIASAVALPFASPSVAPAATEFPTGSLALGHPALESEGFAVGGIVSSHVPAVAHTAANELLVTVAPNAKATVEALIRSHAGLTLVGALPDLPAILVRSDPGGRSRIVGWLRAQDGVETVQPDTIERPDEVPDDPGFAYQWYLDNSPATTQPPGSGAPIYGADVDAPQAWSQTLGSAAIRIAIVDTGIDGGHPDLAGKVVAAANFTASNTSADLSGHGTHVAGVAAASFDTPPALREWRRTPGCWTSRSWRSTRTARPPATARTWPTGSCGPPTTAPT
jgi:subtilisin family serine protease